MKSLSCYNCESPDRNFYAEENGFSLLKCQKCGLLYIEERPDDDEISQAHKQGKHRGTDELNVTGKFEPREIRKYLRVLADIYGKEKIDSPRTWLDIGCGHGEFMRAVDQYAGGRVKLKGTDPNVHKQESARSKGLDVSYFPLDSHEEKYDVISLLNVYSHLPDPPKFIQLLKELLNDGGELILETGDTANMSPTEHYRPFFLPDHLSFASEEIVISILENLGFEILSVKKYPYLRHDAKTFLKELVKFILPNHKSRLYYYANLKLYSQTDMFVRAKLKT